MHREKPELLSLDGEDPMALLSRLRLSSDYGCWCMRQKLMMPGIHQNRSTNILAYVKSIFILRILRILNGDDIALETKPGNPIHRFILTIHMWFHQNRIMCSNSTCRSLTGMNGHFAHQWFGCIY